MRVCVKICGITRPADGVAAARLGADAIGLVFYPPSPRFVTVETAQQVIAALPPFVTVVGLLRFRITNGAIPAQSACWTVMAAINREVPGAVLTGREFRLKIPCCSRLHKPRRQ
ncbi:MAG: hypothetical protein HC889_07490 [Synechococcaceae cyanobacterium SM1_2_3]|nr:hypothetical protein [Synechococcaceae cyanobacterium SM1_2_3]